MPGSGNSGNSKYKRKKKTLRNDKKGRNRQRERKIIGQKSKGEQSRNIYG